MLVKIESVKTVRNDSRPEDQVRHNPYVCQLTLATVSDESPFSSIKPVMTMTIGKLRHYREAQDIVYKQLGMLLVHDACESAVHDEELQDAIWREEVNALIEAGMDKPKPVADEVAGVDTTF